jgi:hypothetical protein
VAVRKGRKDSGDFYEVFRKITSSQKTERAFAEPTPAGRPEEPSKGPENPTAPTTIAAAEPVRIPGRAFILTYNTAVITFIAVIIVVVWAYMMGYHNGRQQNTQDKLLRASEQIKFDQGTTVTTIPLVDEQPSPNETFTVEVLRSVPLSDLDNIERNARTYLTAQGYESFIARGEDGQSLALWVGRFPNNSIAGGNTMEKMRSLPSRAGTAAFPEPKFVKFVQARVVK